MQEDRIEFNDERLFVARQPVIDRHGRCVGYELLFRDTTATHACITDDLLCTVAVVERSIGMIGLEALLGTADGYLNCSADFLFSDMLDVLPASQFVLEVLETCELTPALAERCTKLRGSGFRIALDDVREITPEIVAFLPVVDIVKLDWPYIPRERHATAVSFFKGKGQIVLAEKIETPEEQCVAKNLGCDFFQGYFFAKPQLMNARRAMPCFAAVLRIFQMIMAEASQEHIAIALASVPSLIVQILRLANSGGQVHSQSKPISSVRQALSVAGERKVMQWCCLLLYANPDGLPIEEDPLARLAERRGLFMRRAVASVAPDFIELQQKAFLTGVLSLLHVAHGAEADGFVRQLPVSDDICKAIVEREGTLGTLLKIAELLEHGQYAAAREESADVSPKLGDHLLAMCPM